MSFLHFLFSQSVDFQSLPPESVKLSVVQSAKDLSKLEPDVRMTPVFFSSSLPSPIYSKLHGYTQGKHSCDIMLNLNEDAWANWAILTEGADPKLWPALVKFATFHELAHCLQYKQDLHVTRKDGEMGGVLEVRSAETYADIFGILTLTRYYPKDTVQAVLTQLITARAGSNGGYTESHDSSAKLKSIQNYLESTGYASVSHAQALSMAVDLANQPD